MIPSPSRGATKASTIIDCAAEAEPDGALAWLALAVQKRLVPVETLEAEVGQAHPPPARRPHARAMADVTSGAHSAAEVRYVRDVSRPSPAHRDPAVCQQGERWIGA